MDTQDEIEFSQAIDRTEARYNKKIRLAITKIEKGAINTGLKVLKELVKNGY